MNQDVLDSLLELDGDTGSSLLLDLIAAYNSEVPNRLPKLSLFAKRRDGVRLAFEAHALKSTFANFGAEFMAVQLATIEDSAKQSDWPQIEVSLKNLTQGLAEFETDLKSLEQQVVQARRTRAS